MENDLSVKVEKIVKRIREVRKQKGLSHDNMAHELDMSTSAYNKLERGETTLSLERLFKIIQVLEISLSDVFEIKNGDIIQDLKDHSIGKVETLNQENKEKSEKIIELYEERLKDKDAMITQLQKMLEKFS